LEKLLRIEIGLQLTTRALLPLLKIGTTAACFHNEGNFPLDKLRLKIWSKRGIKISEQPLIIKLGISSGPADFVERR
jgi:hypothetical protein